MNYKRLLSLMPRFEFCQRRFQHGREVVSADGSLPSNLVLFGISKDKVAKETTVLEVDPPDDSIPIIRHCVDKIPKHKSVINVWVDNLAHAQPKYVTATQLHPSVFGVHPRMDILHEVCQWQKRYREVDYTWTRSRADFGRGKRKPWPQKGTGLKRQGSKTPPFWKGGGICHGPKGPKSHFYQLSDYALVHGITIALTIKLLQNDLLIVNNLEIPEPEFNLFGDFMNNRNMAENSMLLVHDKENHPVNLSKVLETSRTVTIMPTAALNVWSILKHDKLVLCTDVLDDLEPKLIWHFKRYSWLGQPHNFYKDMPGADRLKKAKLAQIELEENEKNDQIV